MSAETDGYARRRLSRRAAANRAAGRRLETVVNRRASPKATCLGALDFGSLRSPERAGTPMPHESALDGRQPETKGMIHQFMNYSIRIIPAAGPETPRAGTGARELTRPNAVRSVQGAKGAARCRRLGATLPVVSRSARVGLVVARKSA
jgi:hypothetical protein